jgi:hypothetical protein
MVAMAPWVVTIIAASISAAVSLTAVYFSESLRRRVRGQIDLRVAEMRFEAYAALWDLTKAASPMLDAPLTENERANLFADMTDWYYSKGKGMLLSEEARNIYLKAKANLTCADGDVEPGILADQVTDHKVDRSTLSKQQLSLLRTAIRADLRIFTQPYGPPPEARDDVRARGRAFLADCGIDLTKRPWRDAFP